MSCLIFQQEIPGSPKASFCRVKPGVYTLGIDRKVIQILEILPLSGNAYIGRLPLIHPEFAVKEGVIVGCKGSAAPQSQVSPILF